MISWFLGRVKWLFLLAAVGGPALAFMSYSEANEIKDVLANGQEATATIDGGTISKGRRSGTSYSINLTWTDKSGTKQVADKVKISSPFASKLIVGDKLVRDTVKIKYLANTPDVKPVVIEDAKQRIQNDEEMLPVGLAGGVVGLLGAAAFFYFGRRRQAEA
jgi:hypothetical protein